MCQVPLGVRAGESGRSRPRPPLPRAVATEGTENTPACRAWIHSGGAAPRKGGSVAYAAGAEETAKRMRNPATRRRKIADKEPPACPVPLRVSAVIQETVKPHRGPARACAHCGSVSHDAPAIP